MRTITKITLLLAIASLVFVRPAASATDKAIGRPVIVLAGHEKWISNDRWVKGDMLAFLKGRPRAPGQWLLREKVPPHLVSAVHYHPQGENNTVLAGTWYVGFGDKIDPRKVIALPKGSYIYIPPGLHHYAMTQGEAVILESSGRGPFRSIRVR